MVVFRWWVQTQLMFLFSLSIIQNFSSKFLLITFPCQVSCCCYWVTKSCPNLLWPPWTVARQVPLSMGFSRQEWVAISSPKRSSWTKDRICISYLAGRFFTSEPPRKPKCLVSAFKEPKHLGPFRLLWWNTIDWWLINNKHFWDFPGDPVGKTPCSQCRGLSSIPGSRWELNPTCHS